MGYFDLKESICIRDDINSLPDDKILELSILSLFHTIPTFNDPEQVNFQKHFGKGEIAGFQHLILFSQSFLPLPNQISTFDLH